MFNSRNAFEDYVEELDCFAFQSSNETKKGTVSYYRCSNVPKRAATKCPVQLKVLESKATNDFRVSITTLMHNHDGINRKRLPSAEILSKIFDLSLIRGMLPAKIRLFLEQNYDTEIYDIPTIRQIRYILTKEHEANTSQTNIHGELIE